MSGSNIYGVLLDSLGNCWCSHQRGLSQIKAIDFHIINYDKADGIQDWDFNNRAYYKSRDGRLFFGGVSGLNMIDPYYTQRSFYHPLAYIDDIFINGKIWKTNSSHHLIDKLNLETEDNQLQLN